MSKDSGGVRSLYTSSKIVNVYSFRGNGTQPVLIAVTIGLVYLVVIGNQALGPDGVQDFPYDMALAMLIKPLFHVKMLPEVKARIDAIWKESGLS